MMRIAWTVLIAWCLSLAGCHGDDEHPDACASCYGAQTATPDGKCPTCGAPAKPTGGGGRH